MPCLPTFKHWLQLVRPTADSQDVCAALTAVLHPIPHPKCGFWCYLLAQCWIQFTCECTAGPDCPSSCVYIDIT